MGSGSAQARAALLLVEHRGETLGENPVVGEEEKAARVEVELHDVDRAHVVARLVHKRLAKLEPFQLDGRLQRLLRRGRRAGASGVRLAHAAEQVENVLGARAEGR